MASCTSIFTSPVTVGYHVNRSSVRNRNGTANIAKRQNNAEEDRHDASIDPYQDGFISAWVFFIFLASTATSITIGQWITKEQTFSIEHTAVQICMCVLMTICILAFLMFLCSDKCRKCVAHRPPGNNQISSHDEPLNYCRQMTKKILPLIGIVIFLIGSIIYDILEIIANSLCIEDYEDNNMHDFYYRNSVVSVVYHLIKIHFTALLTVFCGMFVIEELRFYRCRTARYTCILILTAVLWLWLDTQLYESQHSEPSNMHSSYLDNNNDHCICSSSMANTSYTCQCICQNTALFDHVHYSATFLFSFIVKYCLLVIECILHIMLTMEDENVANELDNKAFRVNIEFVNPVENVPVLIAGVGGVENGYDSISLFDGNEEVNEGTSLLRQHNTQQKRYDHRSEPSNVGENLNNAPYTSARNETGSTNLVANINAEQNENNYVNQIEYSDTFSMCRFSLVYLALLLGITSILLTFIATFNLNDTNHDNRFTRGYYFYDLLYQLVGIVVTYIGFSCTRNFISKHNGYNGFEMLVLFSSAGFFIFVMFILIACVAVIMDTQPKNTNQLLMLSTTDKKATIIFMVDTIFNCWQVYLQSVFMLHVSKIIIPESERNKLNILKQVLLYLAITNLCTWIFENFLQLKYIQSVLPIQAYYYGEENWAIISHITFPVMMFYRFNSCIHCLGMYFSF